MRFTRMSIATLVILSNLVITFIVLKFRRCRRSTCGILIGVLAFIDAIEGKLITHVALKRRAPSRTALVFRAVPAVV